MHSQRCRPPVCSGRRKGGPKRTALKFEFDGKDLTCLEQRLTQAEVDRVLGSDLLVRAVFHGQADVTALLEVPCVPFLMSQMSVLLWLCTRCVWQQHSTAQHSTAQHSTAQHSTAQHSTAQHSTAQHSTACIIKSFVQAVYLSAVRWNQTLCCCLVSDCESRLSSVPRRVAHRHCCIYDINKQNACLANRHQVLLCSCGSC